MNTNLIFHMIEYAFKGEIDQCLTYCEKIYDLIPHDYNDLSKENFLRLCKKFIVDLYNANSK